MSLLNNSKQYSRPTSSTKLEFQQTQPSVIAVLESEKLDLEKQLEEIQESKSREPQLQARLYVVVQSLDAFQALEKSNESVVDTPAQVTPPSSERRLRKAARKTVTETSSKPDQRSIDSTTDISNTEKVAHNDFLQFN